MGDPAPGEGDKGGGGDIRHEWMRSRVAVTLKVKPEKFSELLNDEEEGGGM